MKKEPLAGSFFYFAGQAPPGTAGPPDSLRLNPGQTGGRSGCLESKASWVRGRSPWQLAPGVFPEAPPAASDGRGLSFLCAEI